MKLNRTVIMTVAAGLLVAGGVGYGLWRRNSGTPSEQSLPGVTVTTNQDMANSDNGGNNSKVTTGSGQSGETNAKLGPPSGAFVSNHQPNLDGDPAPNQMNSTCTSVAEATCEIRFSKGSEVKILGPNKVGANGSISWDWKLQDLGLTEGTWQIEAIARLGSQSATARDSLPLEVGP